MACVEVNDDFHPLGKQKPAVSAGCAEFGQQDPWIVLFILWARHCSSCPLPTCYVMTVAAIHYRRIGGTYLGPRPEAVGLGTTKGYLRLG